MVYRIFKIYLIPNTFKDIHYGYCSLHHISYNACDPRDYR